MAQPLIIEPFYRTRTLARRLAFVAAWMVGISLALGVALLIAVDLLVVSWSLP